MTSAEIAQVGYEVSQAFLAANGITVPNWSSLDSAVKGALTADAEEFIENGPSAIQRHDVNITSLKTAGWTYGTTEDPAKKQSPLIVPFASLPDVEKQKLEIFRQVCISLTAELEE